MRFTYSEMLLKSMVILEKLHSKHFRHERSKNSKRMIMNRALDSTRISGYLTMKEQCYVDSALKCCIYSHTHTISWCGEKY